MQEEAQLLIEAIESLKQESSLFKEYLFPIISAFFTSILGAGIAYLTFRSQESLQIEKEKIIHSNKWILSFQTAFNNLIAYKSNYHGILVSEDPIERVFQIPLILNKTKLIAEDLSSLSFLVSSKNISKDNLIKWEQLPLIGALEGNYNQVILLFNKQLELKLEVKEKMEKHYKNKEIPEMNAEKIIDVVGLSTIIPLVDLSERIILLVDDLIFELRDFLSEFPKVAESHIQTKRLRSYGSILFYSIDENEKLVELMKKSPKANDKLLSKLFNEDFDVIKERFRTGY